MNKSKNWWKKSNSNNYNLFNNIFPNKYYRLEEKINQSYSEKSKLTLKS